jgi:hypothetical protein
MRAGLLRAQEILQRHLDEIDRALHSNLRDAGAHNRLQNMKTAINAAYGDIEREIDNAFSTYNCPMCGDKHTEPCEFL